jgi:carboxylate-amine ligase
LHRFAHADRTGAAGAPTARDNGTQRATRPSEGFMDISRYPGTRNLAFKGSPEPTIGVEVEVWLVDPQTYQLTPRATDVLDRASDPMRFKPELFQAIVELNTDICKTAADVRRDLHGRFKELLGICRDLGIGCMAIGTHPFTDWRLQPITNKERYQRLVDRMGWAGRRLLICGLHVHVGVPSGEHAIAVLNSLTAYIPHLLALSASSPYWLGRDTQLASARVKVFECLPTAGLPQRPANWTEFSSLMRTLISAEAIESIREIWWDIRPHPEFGTVEIRICDGVNTLDEIVAISALIQALVARLVELYDRGEEMPILKGWTTAENKWRAARWALDAQIIRNERGEQVEIKRHLEETLQMLEPVATRLGSRTELDFVRTIAERGPNTERQRSFYRQAGDLHDVVAAMIEEFAHNVG